MAVVDLETGEVLESRELVLPSVELVTAGFAEYVRQTVGGFDFEAAMQSKRQLEALEAYVVDKKQRAEVQAAARWTEVRIGELLGPGEVGVNQHSEPSLATEGSLARMERYEFRRMATHHEIVAACIALGKPARRHILRAIDDALRPVPVYEGPTQPVVVQRDAVEWLDEQVDEGYDLLLTDPPYSTDVPDIMVFAASWLPLALRSLAPTGRAFVCIGAYPEELRAYLNVVAGVDGWRVEDVLVWTFRNTIGPAGKGFMPNWQAILHVVGPETPPPTFDQLVDRFSVFDINAPDGRHDGRRHAWEKPEALGDALIARAGAVRSMFDPFAGTGTFLVCAAKAGIQAIGAERDEAMIKLAGERGITR